MVFISASANQHQQQSQLAAAGPGNRRPQIALTYWIKSSQDGVGLTCSPHSCEAQKLETTSTQKVSTPWVLRIHHNEGAWAGGALQIWLENGNNNYGQLWRFYKKLESRASIQQSHCWVHSQMTGRPYAKGISVHPCPHSCPTSQITESTVYW